MDIRISSRERGISWVNISKKKKKKELTKKVIPKFFHTLIDHNFLMKIPNFKFHFRRSTRAQRVRGVTNNMRIKVSLY